MISVEAEYAALRAEILQRAEFQQRTVHLAIVIVGTLATVFFQFRSPPWVLLIYPVLSVALAAEWAFNNVRIMQIGSYIRDTVETGRPGWEHFLQSHASAPRLRWVSGVVFAHGIFVLMPLLCIAAAFLLSARLSVYELALACFDVALTLVVTPVILRLSEARGYSLGSRTPPLPR